MVGVVNDSIRNPMVVVCLMIDQSFQLYITVLARFLIYWYILTFYSDFNEVSWYIKPKEYCKKICDWFLFNNNLT